MITLVKTVLVTDTTSIINRGTSGIENINKCILKVNTIKDTTRYEESLECKNRS